MEQHTWENFAPPMEMMDQDNDLLEECLSDDEEFLRDILLQPSFSSESETSPINNNLGFAAVAGGDEIGGSDRRRNSPSPLPRPRTYILSFDNSTIIAATPEPSLGHEQRSSSKSNSNPNRKRSVEVENVNAEVKLPIRGAKKSRNNSQIRDHIMAERKRRQELSERFIALSATIPGLKKTDKNSVLREAINYVKQLKERVTELEERNKRGKESMIILKKTELLYSANEDCFRPNSELLPDIEVRVLENEVLIEIHCEKEDGIELKILEQLENLHLCVTGSSILPFGNSTMDITIVAQMGDAYKMTVNELVKNLRQVLVNIGPH